MKVIKKSEIKPQTCECCGSVIQVKHKNLQRVLWGVTNDDYVTIWNCPLCRHANRIILNSKKNYEKTVNKRG